MFSDSEIDIIPMSKGELAMMYSPHLTQRSATRRLALWIDMNQTLLNALAQSGYRKTARVLTAKQVGLIVEHLGEP